MAERERAEEAYAKKKNAELIRNLQEQIEENKATKAALDRQKYLEGGRIKQELVSALLCECVRSSICANKLLLIRCFQLVFNS